MYDIILKIIQFTFLFCFVLSIGSASASDGHIDNFNTFNTSQWTEISGIWQTVNGTLTNTVGEAVIIYEGWEGKQYISEIDLTANKSTGIKDYAQPGFFIYYKDSSNFGRVLFIDDNRGDDYNDNIQTGEKGISFSNSQTYINNSINTSITFESNVMHHLKLVRLNELVYVYHNGKLVFTTKFKDENPEGKVGIFCYASTGYFDNFYLRPITMNNASGYINELNLTSTNPTTRVGSIYTLHLEEAANGNAFFSLSKFGKTVDSAVGSEGDTVFLNFENGDEAVNFKVTRLFDAVNNSAVWLEDIISASTDDLNIGADDITINPSYHQDENMPILFSVKNMGGVTYSGTPEITISTEGDSKTINPELDLVSNESEEFRVVLKTPKKQGGQRLTISVKTEYSTTEKSVDYQVRVLNPAVTTLSADLQEDDGIHGTVSIGSPFSPELVDWNTTASIKVYKLIENGKTEIYSKDVPVTVNAFNVDIAYDDFYRGDGQYVITVGIGEMLDSDFFEIMGQDYAYAPLSEELPPTVVPSELYPPLVMLLIGMFAAVSVRNHMHKVARSLPLDILFIICGLAVLAVALLKSQSGMATVGIIVMGTGICAVIVKKSGSAVGKLLLMDSHLHDFAGMLLVFASAGYIIMQVPEWSFMVVVGTLISFYTVLNLHHHESVQSQASTVYRE